MVDAPGGEKDRGREGGDAIMGVRERGESGGRKPMQDGPKGR